MTSKKVRGILLLSAILAIVFIVGQYREPIENVNSEGTNIIAFGDSLAYGVGATERGKNDMFSLVSSEVGVPILNVGVAGNTTADALLRIESDVLANDPKIVFVLFGGNDYLQKVPKEETFNNLEMMIKKIQAAGAAVVLVGVRGGVFVDRFEEDYKILAKKYKTGYVPNILDGLITNRDYMYDSVHPNDRGYRIAATRLSPVLKQILEESN